MPRSTPLSILHLIEQVLRAECGISPGAELVAGVSGGSDSVCLLHALVELGHRPLVAHFDHQLRPGSAAEAERVRDLASSLGLQFAAGREDVAAHARNRGRSVEEAARHLRYGFLFSLARRHEAVAVAVGHTADDQAETVLMHLLRGTGIAGLAGMQARTVLPDFDAALPVVRPLLGLSRKQTAAYCRLRKLPVIQDPSNAERQYLRNRVRLDLIPTLESYNPQIRSALVRLAQSAADDMSLITHSVGAAWQRLSVDRGEAYVGFDAASLATEMPALQRRLVKASALAILPGADLGFEDLERARQFIAHATERQCQLGDGITLFRELHTIFVALGEDHLPTDRWPQLPGRSLAVGLGVSAPVSLEGDWCFTTELASGEISTMAGPAEGELFRGRLDADLLPPRLLLRAPRPGDRMRPLGLSGHTQKLSDVFTNMRVPTRLRRRWPVLVSEDQIVWLPGFRIADQFRITPATRRSALVTVHRLG